MTAVAAPSSGYDSEQNLKETINADIDIERAAAGEAHLRNTTVQNVSWTGITITVKDRETKLPKTLVDNVSGIVQAGPQTHFLPNLSRGEKKARKAPAD